MLPTMVLDCVDSDSSESVVVECGNRRVARFILVSRYGCDGTAMCHIFFIHTSGPLTTRS